MLLSMDISRNTWRAAKSENEILFFLVERLHFGLEIGRAEICGPAPALRFFSMATELLRQFRALCSACTSILSTRKIPTFTVLQCSIVLPLLNYCYHLGCHNDVHTDHWQSFATPKFANQSSFEQSFSHHNLQSWSTNFQTHPHHHNIYIYCLSMPICIPSW